MQKILLFIFLFIGAVHQGMSQCEIENPSFEDWTLQPFELVDFNENVLASNDVFLPDSTTTLARFLFLLFGASLDPSIAAALESDPQGFIGMQQSTDATEGEFALQLQGGFGIDIADVYHVNDCVEVPDSFYLDVKHTGQEDDTLQIIVIYNEGLGFLPQDTSDLADFPAYVFTELTFTDDTEYERISLPVIENFDAAVDTFYYSILATTHNESFFTIDNLGTAMEMEEPTCEFDGMAPFSLSQLEPICICDGNEDIGSENAFLGDVIPSDEFPPVVVIVDENDDILFEGIEEMGQVFFEDDFCVEGDLFAVQILYNEDTDMIEADNLADFTGCFALSQRLPLEIITSEIPIPEASVDGEVVPIDDQLVLCKVDDLVEEFTFNNTTDLDVTWLLVQEVGDGSIVIDQWDHSETRVLENYDAGEYVLGAIAHAFEFPDFVGMVIDENTPFACWYISEDAYEITILDNGDAGCISSVQDDYILQSVKLLQNPVENRVILEVQQLNTDANIILRDLHGHIIEVKNYIQDANLIDFDTQNLVSGTYFISVNTHSAQATYKFVKI